MIFIVELLSGDRGPDQKWSKPKLAPCYSPLTAHLGLTSPEKATQAIIASNAPCWPAMVR
jgi:hypothetical protein